MIQPFFLENLSCLEEAINHFNAFQKISGLKLNMEKTVIIPLGPFRNILISLPDWLKELHIKLDSFQTLGVWFSTDAAERTKRNFDEKLRKVETIIQIWKQRNLSWKGRIVIIKSLILSQFTHLFSMLYTPPYVLEKLKRLILNFLWNNKPPRVKYETMIANIKDGGLKLPDITSFHNAQKAFWIKRLQTSRGKWKNLFLILSNLNSLLLDHKLQVSDVSPCKIGSFHHQVLNCWYDIKSTQPLTMIELYNEYVFMNKFILVNNAPLTPRMLGMSDDFLNLKIIDFLDEKKKLIPAKNLKRKFKCRATILDIQCLISAIPVTWKRKFQIHTESFQRLSEFNIQINKKPKELFKLKSSEIYWELVNNKIKAPTALYTWIDLFPFLEKLEWSEIFSLAHKISKEPYLQSFQFKILHRTVNCGYNLFKWNLVNSAVCNYCNLCIDTIEHHFYYCAASQDFWMNVSDWLNSFTRESFSLSICEVLLGIIKTSTTDTHYYTHNYVIILGKWFINLKKNNKERIWFPDYIAHVKNKVRVLKESFTVTNNVKVFKQRYGKLYDHLCD